jgi:hypothetical protein
MEIQVINIINMGGTFVSTFICIFSRFTYYKEIFQSVRMRRPIRVKERIYSAIIMISSIVRMAMYLLDIIDLDFGRFVRNFDSNCYDVTPYHALILITVTFLVDLLPVYIFSKMFTTMEQQKKTFTEIQRTLHSSDPS